MHVAACGSVAWPRRGAAAASTARRASARRLSASARFSRAALTARAARKLGCDASAALTQLRNHAPKALRASPPASSHFDAASATARRGPCLVKR